VNHVITRRLAVIVVCVAALAFAGRVASVVRAPAEIPESPLLIRDVTQLNPIPVNAVIAPTTTEEIVDAVKQHHGPVSVGGARHSMGGQIATAGTLHIDMRRFNRILEFSPDAKTITVQAGARWRQILEYIDPANLSVTIMQSYANFTVGGSLSANVHGRYVRRGPIIESVKSIKVVMPDGSLIDATPGGNPDLFNGVIGGYGGLGVIVEATLALTENVRVERQDQTIPIDRYPRYFLDHVRDAARAVFHNGDIYPPRYDTVHTITYIQTEEAATVAERLIPLHGSYRLDRFTYWVVSEWPFGKTIRRRVIDPAVFHGRSITSRNYQSSYDAAELEPSSRASSTYALQEYFVPVDRFGDFVPRMREVLLRHDANVINISIRQVLQDSQSLLAWARADVFGFVIYYKQGTSAAAQNEVGVWARELIDAALSVGGTYYLPYQLHATEAQFRLAYPRAPEFFALKRRLDPAGKFRNQLWDKYRE